jgi:hypothetical protein
MDMAFRGALTAVEAASTGVQLYERNGYTTIGEDPDWKTWFGGRKRLLMAKTSSNYVPSSIQSISTNLLRAWRHQEAA